MADQNISSHDQDGSLFRPGPVRCQFCMGLVVRREGQPKGGAHGAGGIHAQPGATTSGPLQRFSWAGLGRGAGAVYNVEIKA